MTRDFTDIGSEEAVTSMYTMEQSDYYEDISSDEEQHEKVQKKETDKEANVEAAVVPGPSERPSDSGLMMVDVVPSTSREGAPVTERSHQEERADDGDDERANADTILKFIFTGTYKVLSVLKYTYTNILL